MRRATTAITALISAGLSLSATALAQSGPNLIFILTDDQGVESIEGPYWSNEMGCITPTLDALARQGVSFTNCRVNPNCSPTRAALMTGRCALDTGVNGVLGRYDSPQEGNPCHPDVGPLIGTEAQVTNRLALQNQERTIAEVLHDMGYYTVLVDKWHLGYNEGDPPEDLGLLPTQQGFDEFYDWQDTICDGYPNTFYADLHMVDAAEFAVAAVGRRALNQKYALFFHTITPHRRHSDNPNSGSPDDGYLWWAIEDQNLVPETGTMTIDPPDQGGQEDRFIQNVEAMDSVIRGMLLDLNIIEDDRLHGWPYRSQSEAVIFFAADNGTDPLVTSYRSGEWEGRRTPCTKAGSMSRCS